MIAACGNEKSCAGGAWEQRPSHAVTLTDHRLSATRRKPLEVLRYDDATVFDRLLAAGYISARQHDAARIGHMMMLAAGLMPRVVGRIDTIDDVIEEAFEERPDRDTRAPDAPTPRDRYRALMRGLGGVHAELIEALLLGEIPRRARLPKLIDALDNLANLVGAH